MSRISRLEHKPRELGQVASGCLVDVATTHIRQSTPTLLKPDLSGGCCPSQLCLC